LLKEQMLDELCGVAEREGRSAHARANAAIRSPQYTAALLKLLQWFASRRWRNQPVSEHSALLMAPITTKSRRKKNGTRHPQVRNWSPL
jgi:triphosphatase